MKRNLILYLLTTQFINFILVLLYNYCLIKNNYVPITSPMIIWSSIFVIISTIIVLCIFIGNYTDNKVIIKEPIVYTEEYLLNQIRFSIKSEDWKEVRRLQKILYHK